MYEFHEIAAIFPMLSESDLQDLANDIEKSGQREDVVLYEGKILDGRNRWLACKLKGITPTTRIFKGDDEAAMSLVMSLNLHRRHLTPSQASMCAARARSIYEERAEQRMKAGAKLTNNVNPVANLPQGSTGKARDQVGKAFGVSGKSVDHAKRVIDKGIPELAKAVDEGRMAVSTAALLATEPEESQREEIASPKRNRTYKPVVGGGEITKPVEPTRPKHAGEHNKSELFAINKAQVAITQLKGIPMGNSHRDAALEVVIQWISTQRKSK